MKTLIFRLALLWGVWAMAQASWAVSSSEVNAPQEKFSRSLSLWSGFSNEHDLLEIIRFQWGKFEPYPVVGIQYTQNLYRPSSYYRFEWAANLVKHFESWDLFELDGYILFRWDWFPWNQWLPTHLRFGEGVSWASGYPSSESISQNIRSQVLNYLYVGVQISHPQLPEWALDLVLHHRSGIYGLISGVRGGSNYLCIGITRRFD